MSAYNQKFAPSAPVAVLMLALLLSGCDDLQDQGHGDPAPPAQEVTIAEVSYEPVEVVHEFSGRLRASRTVEIRPQVGGIVGAHLFEEGSLVREGDELFRIEDSSYRADVEIAKAELQRAEAGLDHARSVFERRQSLLSRSAVSRQDFDTAKAELKRAEADVAAARARLSRAMIDLGNTVITAPMTAHVGEALVNEGALVTVSQQQPLAVLSSIDPLHLPFTQPVRDYLELVQALNEGRLVQEDGYPKVRLYLLHGPANPVFGAVDFRDAVIDEASDSLLLRAVIANSEHVLLPGMFVRGHVSYGVMPEAIEVPQRAVSFNPDGSAWVWVLEEGDVVSRRAVKIASTKSSGKWQVTDGLRVGDRYVVDGALGLREGASVSASPVS